MWHSWTKSPNREEVVAKQYGDAGKVAGYIAGYQGCTPDARNYYSRFHAVDQALAGSPGGDLLDVGCGPGMFVEHLRQTRPGDFCITAADQSVEMIAAAAERVGGTPDVRLAVAGIEDLPYPEANFDAVVAIGVLEYVDVRRALREIARVLRPGGVAALSMLNPRSPYRTVEWRLYWPARRVLGRVERAFSMPPERRHDVAASGIQALPATRLATEMRDVGLGADDTIFYDVTPLVPPIDKVLRPRLRRWCTRPDTTLTRKRLLGVLGTGYVIAGRRAPKTGAPVRYHRQVGACQGG